MSDTKLSKEQREEMENILEAGIKSGLWFKDDAHWIRLGWKAGVESERKRAQHAINILEMFADPDNTTAWWVKCQLATEALAQYHKGTYETCDT